MNLDDSFIFNRHREFEGKHAFLSASKYHWLNYDEDRLVTVYNNEQAKLRGTLLHKFACDAITFGIPLSDTNDTINMYVNTCIADEMIPEVVLYYSTNAFGTADAISFRNNELRIYDLKTGSTKASMKQLYIYAALFCLEYGIVPFDISIHLRIYQNNEVLFCSPGAEEISEVMDRIITFDNIIRSISKG